jgi:hypothetical protein
MLTHRFLKQALREDFDYSTTQRGKTLFETKSVLSISIESNDIHALVLELGNSFLITFNYAENEDYIKFEGMCTCGKLNCQHQAAVLYAAIDANEIKQIKSKKTIPIPTPPKPKPISYNLEGKHAGKYRLLPLPNSLANSLILYGSTQYPRLSWNETFEGNYISPHELEIKNIQEGSYHRNSNKYKISIKIEKDGEVYVQCLNCSDTKNKLCNHQLTLLNAAKEVLEKFVLNNPNHYQESLEDAAQQLKLSPKIITKYYQVKLLSGGLVVVGNKSNMVNNKWLELTQNIQLNTIYERADLIQQETNRLEEGRKIQYGFFWANLGKYNYDDDPMEFPIFFVSGGAYKNKPGIRDANKNLNIVPKGFPAAQQKIGQQLFFHAQEQNAPTRFQLIKDLIQNNLEDFNEIYQYIYDGDASYSTPRVSDLNLIEFESQPLECNVSFEVIDGLTHLTRHITHEGEPFNYHKTIYQNEVFCATKTHAFLLPHHRFIEFMKIFPDEHDTIILPSMDKIQHTNLINQFKSSFEVTAAPELMMEEIILQNPQLQILLREAGNFILFEPRLKYDDQSFNAFEKDSYYIEEQLFRVAEEDRLYLIDFLKQSHPEFDQPIQVQDYVFIEVKEMINNYWFVHFNEACEAAGIEVLGQKDLTKFKYSKFRAKTYMHIKSGIDWFDVDAGISFGKENVKISDWIRALRNKESFIKLKQNVGSCRCRKRRVKNFKISLQCYR